jgi:hypothetical protein
MSDPIWILMVKGDEQKLVHPGNVDNHERAGWAVADASAAKQAQATVQEVEQAIDTLVADFLAFEAPAEASDALPPAEAESLDVLRAAPASKKRKAKSV